MAAVIPATLGVAGAVFLAPIIVTGVVLPVIGFGGSGVVAGSLAAGWQASIGNVVAPSIFASLQSAAAGGYAVAAVGQAASVVSGVVAGSVAVAAAVL